MKKVLKITVAVACLVVLCIGLLVGCAEKPKPEVLNEDTTFYVNSIKTNLINLPDEMWGLVPKLLFDANNTYVKLDASGMLTLNLKVNEGVVALLSLAKLDLSALAEMDLGHMADVYAAAILPGFTLSEGKVRESVELLQSLSAALVLDWDAAEVRKLVKSLEENGRVNADFSIPQKIEIHYEGKYEIKRLPTIHGEKTIVFTDEYGENSEPYLLWYLTTDAAIGARTVHLRIDFLELDLYATGALPKQE